MNSKNFLTSLSSLLLIIAMLSLNSFRYELMGIVPGYASQEFSYLMMVSVPMIFIAFSLSLFVLIREIKLSIRNESRFGLKAFVPSLLALPGLILGGMGLWIFVTIIFERPSKPLDEPNLIERNTETGFNIKPINEDSNLAFTCQIQTTDFENWSIFLLNHQLQVLDRFQFSNLLLPPRIEQLDPHFLMIKVPLRSGLGVFREKTFILSVKDQKLVPALEVISTDKITIASENENYELDFTYDSLSVYLQEKYVKKSQKRTLDSISNTYHLQYDGHKGIFSLPKFTISNGFELLNRRYRFDGKEWKIQED